jgi:hypothetical protein
VNKYTGIQEIPSQEVAEIAQKNLRQYLDTQNPQIDMLSEQTRKEVQRKKNFDPIVVLKKLCAIDTADTVDAASNLEIEIESLSLEKLVDLRNFTAQQDFATTGDSCYVRIDQLLDNKLLREVKGWLNKLMAKNNHFFNMKDYVQLDHLNVSVAEKFLNTIWNEQGIQNELLRVAELSQNTLENSRDYLIRLSKGKDLTSFLEGVRKIYAATFHTVNDEKTLDHIKKLEQANQLKEEEAKKRWWGLWYWLFLKK